jgi:hypothetical protein
MRRVMAVLFENFEKHKVVRRDDEIVKIDGGGANK